MPNTKTNHEDHCENKYCRYCPWLLDSRCLRRIFHEHFSHYPSIVSKRKCTVQNSSNCQIGPHQTSGPVTIAELNNTSLLQNPFKGGTPANANKDIDNAMAVSGILLASPLYFSIL